MGALPHSPRPPVLVLPPIACQPQDLVKSQMQAQSERRAATRVGSSAPLYTPPPASAAVMSRPAASADPSKVAPHRYTSTLDCARTLFREGGVRAFGQGLSATIARNVVGVSAYFWAYEAVRRGLAQRGGRRVEELGAGETLLAGGCGGVAYWVLAYPGDVIKSAMQTVRRGEGRGRGRGRGSVAAPPLPAPPRPAAAG